MQNVTKETETISKAGNLFTIDKESGIQTDSFHDGIYMMKVSVTQEQCDKHGYLCLGEIARLMQKAAKKHFEVVYGFGAEALDPQHKGLVICWMSIEITELPKSGDTLFLKLWQGVGRATTESRRAILTDVKGNVLLTVAGLYLWMDRLERKMTDVPTEIKDCIKTFSFPGEPKLPRMKEREPKVYPCETLRKVKDNEIDHNGHVNNSVYLDWAEEIIDRNELPFAASTSVWIQYNHEITKDSTVKLRYVLEEGQLWLKGSVNDTESFLVKISFLSEKISQNAHQTVINMV